MQIPPKFATLFATLDWLTGTRGANCQEWSALAAAGRYCRDLSIFLLLRYFQIGLIDWRYCSRFHVAARPAIAIVAAARNPGVAAGRVPVCLTGNEKEGRSMIANFEVAAAR